MYTNRELSKRYLIPLSIQHVFAMFGATILVPLLTGLNPSVALFTAGSGTIIYIFITKGQVPSFLGSSFAFIAPIITVSQIYGFEYASGGILATGVFYIIISLIIRFLGSNWINKALPPVVIGSVIIIIGLNLAPTAIKMAMFNAQGEYSLVYTSIAVVTLSTAIIVSVVFKGFLAIIPILLALITGYLFTYIMGMVHPAYNMINTELIKLSPWFYIPQLTTIKFNFVACLSFIIVSLATLCEHLGDVLVTSKVVGKDYYKEPGLKRTILGNGISTLWASIWGGPPNTTYGENIAVMAITKIYSVPVIFCAAIFAILLAFFGKFSGSIQTIPTPVLGGISILLFGIISSSGLRTLVESSVDFKETKNLIVSSVILVIGVGGASLQFPLTTEITFQFSGVALATLIGIILNLVIPATKK